MRFLGKIPSFEQKISDAFYSASYLKRGFNRSIITTKRSKPPSQTTNIRNPV